MKKFIVYFALFISIIACTNTEPEYSDLPANWFKTGWYEVGQQDSNHFSPDITLSFFYNEDSSRVYIENDSLFLKKICTTKDILSNDTVATIIVLKLKITNKKNLSNNEYLFDLESSTFPYDFSYNKSLTYQEGKFTGQMKVTKVIIGSNIYYDAAINGKVVKKNNVIIDNIAFKFVNITNT